MNVVVELIIAIVGGVVVVLIEHCFFESKSSSQSASGSQAPISRIAIPTPLKVAASVSTGVECAYCRFKNREEDRFCVKCGKPLYEKCPNCHRKKPVIEERCGACGKDPKELYRMDQAMLNLRKKAITLGAAYAVVFVRTISLCREPSSVDILSSSVVVLGIVCLALEAYSEFSWFRKTRIWHYRHNWLKTTIPNIEQSYWIFRLIVYSVPVQAILLTVRIMGWLR